MVPGNPVRHFTYPERDQCEAMRERLGAVIPDLQATIEPFAFMPRPKPEEPPKAA